MSDVLFNRRTALGRRDDLDHEVRSQIRVSLFIHGKPIALDE
jgi:hypothetical protein